ncbi:MAG: hypothetical protein KF767_03140 [Bdellovibrionaceae bacterium]|nr:hypothetical protein [Pseudobdellovibrionaceae bacterium]
MSEFEMPPPPPSQVPPVPSKRIYEIDSDDKAWALIQEMASNTAQMDDAVLEFRNYPVVTLHFEGEKFHQSMPARTMKALIELQNDVCRMYALAVYEDSNHPLSDEEKARLEIVFKVEEGSTGITAYIGDALKAFGTEAGKRVNITGRHLVVISLVAAVGYAAPEIHGKLRDAEVEKVKIREQNETERAKIQAEVQKFEAIKAVALSTSKGREALSIVEDSTKKIAQSVTGAEKVTMNDGSEITEKVAKEIYPRKPRRKYDQVQLNGIYQIKTFALEGGGKITIQSAEGKTFYAEFDASNTELKDTLYKGHAGVLELTINARDSEGSYKDIVVIGAKPVQAVAEANTSKTL